MSDSDVWLLNQATRQPRRAERSTSFRYDNSAQVSLVDINGRIALAVEAEGGAPTKKADIEKGEDQKDRWRP